MSADPSFPFYCNDWLSSPVVQRMNHVERSAYLTLLAFCWASGDCSLPDDETELRELAGMTDPIAIGHPDDVSAGNLARCRFARWELVREQFMAHPSLSHRLTNAKLLAVWSERQQWRAERQRSGAAGAAKRWSRKTQETTRIDDTADSLANGSATVLAWQKHASSSSSSSSNKSVGADAPTTHGGKTAKSKPQFIPPTVDDVRAYCQERSNGVDPERWHAHYSANGWKVGRNQMKDWRAAVRTWEQRDRQLPGPSAVPSPSMPSAAKSTSFPAVGASEATDPAAFDSWFVRQQTFDRGDRTRRDLHAIRCSVVRLFRRPEVAAVQLQARLENIALGIPPADPPRAEDIQQAARDIGSLDSAKGAA